MITGSPLSQASLCVRVERFIWTDHADLRLG